VNVAFVVDVNNIINVLRVAFENRTTYMVQVSLQIPNGIRVKYFFFLWEGKLI